jgi:hypothetical protein
VPTGATGRVAPYRGSPATVGGTARAGDHGSDFRMRVASVHGGRVQSESAADALYFQRSDRYIFKGKLHIFRMVWNAPFAEPD